MEKVVSELTPEDSSRTFAATPPLESIRCMLSTMHDGEARRPPADERVLGFYDTNGAHFHSKAGRTVVMEVPREDHECKSWCAVLDTATFGT